jgi:putative nucleotidyltransferase with HDIG domain
MEASSLTIHQDPELLVAEARERSGDRVRYRELAVELAVGAAFVAAATALALFAPWDRAFSGGAFAVCIAAVLIASRVAFEIGDGYAVPTQIVFVAALFVLPKPLVPAAVAAALVLARVLDAAGSRMHPSRVLQSLGDSWYAIGPALVLSLAAPGGVRWSDWPIYVAALGAQFAVDFVWATVRGCLASRVPMRTMVRVLGWVYAVDATLSPMGLLLGFAAADRPYLILLGLPIVGLLAYFAKERRARLDQAFELSGAYRGTAMLLGQVVESDDAYTGEHSRGVVELAMAVADDLGLDSRARLRVEFGALLHDIGKISVPKEILNKPGPLDDEEWKVMHRHTLEGERMLQPIGGLLAEVGHVVRSSHEHFDGSGYPDGLAGAEIPIEARIVSCCDAFSAMTTDRPYRAAMPFEEAVLELQACAGTQFDPAVAKALAAIVTS